MTALWISPWIRNNSKSLQCVHSFCRIGFNWELYLSLVPYLTFTCEIVAMGPAWCISSTRIRRRQQFTLTVAEVERWAGFIVETDERTFHHTTSCCRGYSLHAFVPDSVRDLELSVLHLCRDHVTCRPLPHKRESKDEQAEPNGSHTRLSSSGLFLLCTMIISVASAWAWLCPIYSVVIITLFHAFV